MKIPIILTHSKTMVPAPVLLLFLTLLAASTAHAASLRGHYKRQLAENSDSNNSNIPCTLEYLPVQCGSKQEEFPNLCSAKAAGFKDEDCSPVHEVDDSTNPTTGTSSGSARFQKPCTEEYAPVQCSSDEKEEKEEFGNLCMAEAAGYKEEDCSPVEGQEDENNNTTTTGPGNEEEVVPCTLEYVPVKCGKEEFGNLCMAEAAGYKEKDCSLVVDDEGTNNTTTPCTLEYLPVKCGKEEFGNLCFAEAAGYKAKDCSLMDVDVDTGNNTSSTAITTGPGKDEHAKPCTLEYLPVKCGDEEFDNRCLAEAAGYKGKDCSLMDVDDEGTNNEDDEDTNNNATPCTAEYVPVKCGKEEFPNLCFAEAAGYKEEDCSLVDVDVDTGNNTSSTAITDGPGKKEDKPCTLEYVPVKCGDEEFDNRCFAEAAGYKGKDCSIVVVNEEDTDSSVTITSTSEQTEGVAPCTLEYAPVQCGDNKEGQDMFSNLCEAEASGYKAEECSSVVDVKESDIPCPALERPVVCEGDMVFPNLCEAEKFGMTAESCKEVYQPVIPCTREYNPVLCQGDKFFPNVCEAKNGGMTEEDCVPANEK